MTHEAIPRTRDAVEAGHKVAQLRHTHALVARIAGRSEAVEEIEKLADGARINGAYMAAPEIGQRRFDLIAAETAGWAAAGVEALLAAHATGLPARAAAARLAEELERAIGDLERLLGL
jgi:hypothetical protein